MIAHDTFWDSVLKGYSNSHVNRYVLILNHSFDLQINRRVLFCSIGLAIIAGSSIGSINNWPTIASRREL